MARTAKLVKVPVGAYGPSYYPGKRKDMQRRKYGPEKTPEQIAEAAEKSKAFDQRFLREMAPKWGVAPEDVELFVTDNDAYRAMIEQRKDQQRGLTKLVDREARVAVEGDTDLNHDNLEG